MKSAVLAKNTGGEGGGKSPEELETAVRRIVSCAISSDKVIDIFDAAGLKKPDISILSDEFLAEVQHLPQRNLAVGLLQKLLNNELKIRLKNYLVQSRSFAEMLEATKVAKAEDKELVRENTPTVSLRTSVTRVAVNAIGGRKALFAENESKWSEVLGTVRSGK